MTNNNSLAPRKNTFSTFLTGEAVRRKINEVVGGKDGQRFMSSILSAVSTNPQLANCDHASILSAAFLGESLKLSPSPQLGYYYMVPYNDKERGLIAQFQIGYKGYLQLAMRSGYYKKINVVAIKEGELQSYDILNEEISAIIIDDEEAREKAPTVGYYAMFEYTNGFRKAIYWSKAKMVAHAKKYSPGYASDLRKGNAYTFWSKDFDGMAQKTMIRQLIGKWGILSVDLEKAYETDTGSMASTGEYVDAAVDVQDIKTSESAANNEATQPTEGGAAEDDFFDGADDRPDFLSGDKA